MADEKKKRQNAGRAKTSRNVRRDRPVSSVSFARKGDLRAALARQKDEKENLRERQPDTQNVIRIDFRDESLHQVSNTVTSNSQVKMARYRADRAKKQRRENEQRQVKQLVSASWEVKGLLTVARTVRLGISALIILAALVFFIFELSDRNGVMRELNTLRTAYEEIVKENDAMEREINRSIDSKEYQDKALNEYHMVPATMKQIIYFTRTVKEEIEQKQLIP